MKKLIAIIAAITLTSVTKAQDIKMENDTVYYQGQKFYEGVEVKTSYGSGNQKQFAFIQFGSGLGMSQLPSNYSKSTVVIDKVYKLQGKYYMRGKLKDASTFGAKVFINIEGAVDNNELIKTE